MLYRKDFGGVLSPRSAWVIMVYGLPTLAARMVNMQKTAPRVATWLSQHPKVESVSYPGAGEFPSESARAPADAGPGRQVCAGEHALLRLEGSRGKANAGRETRGLHCRARLHHHAGRQPRADQDPDRTSFHDDAFGAARGAQAGLWHAPGRGPAVARDWKIGATSSAIWRSRWRRCDAGPAEPLGSKAASGWKTSATAIPTTRR